MGVLGLIALNRSLTQSLNTAGRSFADLLRMQLAAQMQAQQEAERWRRELELARLRHEWQRESQLLQGLVSTIGQLAAEGAVTPEEVSAFQDAIKRGDVWTAFGVLGQASSRAQQKRQEEELRMRNQQFVQRLGVEAAKRVTDPKQAEELAREMKVCEQNADVACALGVLSKYNVPFSAAELANMQAEVASRQAQTELTKARTETEKKRPGLIEAQTEATQAQAGETLARTALSRWELLERRATWRFRKAIYEEDAKYRELRNQREELEIKLARARDKREQEEHTKRMKELDVRIAREELQYAVESDRWAVEKEALPYIQLGDLAKKYGAKVAEAFYEQNEDLFKKLGADEEAVRQIINGFKEADTLLSPRARLAYSRAEALAKAAPADEKVREESLRNLERDLKEAGLPDAVVQGVLDTVKAAWSGADWERQLEYWKVRGMKAAGASETSLKDYINALNTAANILSKELKTLESVFNQSCVTVRSLEGLVIGQEVNREQKVTIDGRTLTCADLGNLIASRKLVIADYQSRIYAAAAAALGLPFEGATPEKPREEKPKEPEKKGPNPAFVGLLKRAQNALGKRNKLEDQITKLEADLAEWPEEVSKDALKSLVKVYLGVDASDEELEAIASEYGKRLR